VSGDPPSPTPGRTRWRSEGATGTSRPPRALALRGILLELERIANHLGDLGYLGNDVALSFGFFQFWRLKEDLLRLNAELFGHRYLMDAIAPAGSRPTSHLRRPSSCSRGWKGSGREVVTLRSIYDEHAGAQDRFILTGQVLPSSPGGWGSPGSRPERAA